jgi:uncharacterized heparinase superfamily protein
MDANVQAMRHRMRQITGRQAVHAVARVWFNGVFYPKSLGGRRPRRLLFVPGETSPGDSERGAALMQGEFRFAGQSVREPDALWRPAEVSTDWLAELHAFGWLNDLRAVGGEAARHKARELVADWIATQTRWRTATWRPDVLASRVANWLSAAEFMFAGYDGILWPHYLDSLARQVRHLRRVERLVDPGADRLVILKGLIYASLCLDAEVRRLNRWLTALAAEVDRQIAPDGGHISRSPSVSFEVFRLLVDLRAAIRDAEANVPGTLQNAIDRMAPMIRFFRHGDGGLCLFNDSNEGQPWLTDVVLTRSDARGKPLASAPHTGYERLTANRTLVVVDTGAPAPPSYDEHAHAGTLSFEMSVGKERLIVNCGAYAGANPAWRLAQRATAAHSTVTVEDANSADILPGGRIGRRPTRVASERKEADGNVWIECSHDGYARPFGITHRRRIYLAATGGDVRGEDTLTGAGNHRFTVRFHLHPSVKASTVQGGTSILLQLPTGGGWRVRTTGGVASLQESVYLGVRGERKRTDQIVITGATRDGEAQIKWALTRLAPDG